MAAMNYSSSCFWLTGPYCTEGLAQNWELCAKLVTGEGAIGQKLGIGECILQHATEMEKAMWNQWSFILTLWPAFVSVLCSFGPDPSDFVYDNVWWAALFAATCAGCPGFSSEKPRHYHTVDDAREGHLMCQYNSAEPDPKHPQVVPRSFGRPDHSKVEAVVRVEWTGFVLSWAAYIVFNIFFVRALQQAVVWATYMPLGSAAWYWISAGPALLTIFSEAVQNRVDLYEQAITYLPTESVSVMADDGLAKRSKRTGTSIASELLESTSATVSPSKRFYRCEKQNFLHTWRRIVYLQWTRTPYRLLVNPATDDWRFLLWRTLILLVRVATFVWGSTVMGAVYLMRKEYVFGLAVAIVFVTAVPRVLFRDVWRNKARGADLVVICNRFATELNPSS